LVSRLSGQVINLSQNSTDFINPLDIHKDYGDGEDPIALKSNFILSLCELVVGSKDGFRTCQHFFDNFRLNFCQG